MNIFQKAAARLPLSPQARAFLAFFWQFVLTTLLNALGAFSYGAVLYLIQNGNLSSYQWLPLLALQVVTTCHALATGIQKYITAHADMQYTPVGVAAGDVANDLSAANPLAPANLVNLAEALSQHLGPRLLSGLAQLAGQPQQAPVPQSPSASLPNPQAQPTVLAPAPAPAPVKVGASTAEVSAVTGANWMNQ